MWEIPIDSPLAFWITLAFLGCYMVITFNLVRSFIKLEEICKKHDLDDVEVFLRHPNGDYPDEVKKWAKKSWMNLAFYIFGTILLLWGG